MDEDKDYRLQTLGKWLESKDHQKPRLYKFDQSQEFKNIGSDMGGMCAFMCLDWARRMLTPKKRTYGDEKFAPPQKSFWGATDAENPKRTALIKKLAQGQKIADKSLYSVNLSFELDTVQETFNKMTIGGENARGSRRIAAGRCLFRPLSKIRFQI